MKNVLIILGVLSLLVLGAVSVKAETVSQEIDIKARVDQPVNLGNKFCPVTGEKIDPALKAVYEYEGKIYNFCCPMCIDSFKKNPEKYIKKVEEELKSQSKEENKNITTEADKTMHEGMHH